jgi:hypothetical protein
MGTVQKILYLYGATSQAELTNFVRSQCVIRSEDEFERIMHEWRRAAAKFASLASDITERPEEISTEEIPSKYQNQLERISNEALFRKSFALWPYYFRMVEVDKLVAPQRYVNLDYGQKLGSLIPDQPSTEFLIDFCLKKSSTAPPPAELQLAPNVYAYRSESTDFRFLGGFPKKLTDEDIKYCLQGGEPVAAMILFVGYGAPAVNAYRIGNRIILNNGFHRLFALRQKGIRMVPLVVQEISNWNLELPQIIAGLPASYLVTDVRPSLVKDFLDREISRELLMKGRDRSVQIQWNINQVDIPK